MSQPVESSSIDEAKRRICAQFTEDNLTPDELVFLDNGKIMIDRRAQFPKAIPFQYGTWK